MVAPIRLKYSIMYIADVILISIVYGADLRVLGIENKKLGTGEIATLD